MIVRHIVGFNNPNNDENDDNEMLGAYMHVWDNFDEMFLIGKFLWNNLLSYSALIADTCFFELCCALRLANDGRG